MKKKINKSGHFIFATALHKLHGMNFKNVSTGMVDEMCVNKHVDEDDCSAKKYLKQFFVKPLVEKNWVNEWSDQNWLK